MRAKIAMYAMGAYPQYKYMHMCLLLYMLINVHVNFYLAVDGQLRSDCFLWAFTATETASITSDNRKVCNTNKSELHQSNIYAPLPFHTGCEE